MERAVIDGMDDIYEAWHRRLGHAEYRVTITMAGYGRDEDAADAFLEGFLAKPQSTDSPHPDSSDPSAPIVKMTS